MSNNIEAEAQMKQLAEIVEGWSASEDTEGVAYFIPMKNKLLSDDGPCRLTLDFRSLSELSKFVSSHGDSAAFLEDNLDTKAVEPHRAFVLRSYEDRPEELKLHRVVTTTAAVGDDNDE
jgi:hypothetical protein